MGNLQQAYFPGAGYGLSPVVYIQLAEDIDRMPFDRSKGDDQLGSDFHLGTTGRD